MEGNRALRAGFTPRRKNRHIIVDLVVLYVRKKRPLDYEKVVLIGVINREQDEEKSNEYLDELEISHLHRGRRGRETLLHKRSISPNPKTFIGTGKMEEVSAFVDEYEIGTVIFDDELSPAQQKNIEKILKAKILDRTSLILDIFAQRAQTSYARTQVELCAI